MKPEYAHLVAYYDMEPRRLVAQLRKDPWLLRVVRDAITEAIERRERTRRRFMQRVDQSQVGTGCWIWRGGTKWNGYGKCALDGKRRPAQQVAYNLYVGDIPEGLHLDHLCRTKLCVNPDHLEPVTPAENLRRALVAHGRRAFPTRRVLRNGHFISGISRDGTGDAMLRAMIGSPGMGPTG